MLDGWNDTISIENENYILDLEYCEETKVYQQGVLTRPGGEEVCIFFFSYNGKNELKKVVFWNFIWIESGITTSDKIAVVKYKDDVSKTKLYGESIIDPKQILKVIVENGP